MRPALLRERGVTLPGMTDSEAVADARELVAEAAALIDATGDDDMELLPGHLLDEVTRIAVELSYVRAAVVLGQLAGRAGAIRSMWMLGRLSPTSIRQLLGEAAETAAIDLQLLARDIAGESVGESTASSPHPDE